MKQKHSEMVQSCEIVRSYEMGCKPKGGGKKPPKN
jgi:hypothetical protein